MAAARRIDFPSTLDSTFVVPDIQRFRRHPRPRKRRHALVAQWIERPPPERKVTSPILVEGTHETPPIIMRGVLLLFSLTPSRLVRFVHYEATPL